MNAVVLLSRQNSGDMGICRGAGEFSREITSCLFPQGGDFTWDWLDQTFPGWGGESSGNNWLVHYIFIESNILLNLVTLTSKFDLFYAKFWLIGDRAFIFHMYIACGNTFPNLVHF